MAHNLTGLLNLGYTDPRYIAILNSGPHCVSCPMEITLTNNKHKSYLCSVAANNIMLLSQLPASSAAASCFAHSAPAQRASACGGGSPTTQNSGGHTTLVFTYLTNNAAFPVDQSGPIFPKNAPIKTTKDKIFSQTEFTMSRRLAAHNKCICHFCKRTLCKTQRKSVTVPRKTVYTDF